MRMRRPAFNNQSTAAGAGRGGITVEASVRACSAVRRRCGLRVYPLPGVSGPLGPGQVQLDDNLQGLALWL